MPLNKQLIVAAIIAISAPSATVIAAKSFQDFLIEPSSLRIAQEALNAPMMGAVMPGGTSGGMPSGSGQQPGPGPMVGPFIPGGQPSGMESGSNQMPIPFPGGDMKGFPMMGDQSGQPGQPQPMTGQPQQGSGSNMERCAREVIGDATFDALKRGEKQLGADEKQRIHEKCETFKRGPSQPSAGTFPGRGDFSGNTPSGQFPGQGQGLERAPGAPQQGETRTCRINGVETPGPCPESSGMMPGGETRPAGQDQGGFGQNGPQGMMGPGGFGPSEEDMERMEKEQKSRMLQEVKRNIRGMEQGLSMMTKGLRVCATAKVEIPADVNDALATMKATIAKVKAATDPDEFGDFDFSEFAEIGDRVRDLVDTCHRVKEIPRITRDINREVKRMESDLRRVTTQAKRTKLDLTEQLTEIAQGIAGIKATLAEVTNARDAEAIEAAMEKLEGLRESFEGIQEQLGAVRAVVNMQQGLKQVQREIRDAERRIGFLKRRKVNTAELKQLLAEGKSLVAELGAAMKQKPLDLDAIVEGFTKLEDLGNRAEEAFARAEGKQIKSGFDVGRSPSNELKLDAFEQFRKPQEEPAASSSDAQLESLLGF